MVGGRKKGAEVDILRESQRSFALAKYSEHYINYTCRENYFYISEIRC